MHKNKSMSVLAIVMIFSMVFAGSAFAASESPQLGVLDSSGEFSPELQAATCPNTNLDPDGNGWIKYDGLSGLILSFTAPPGKVILAVCGKAGSHPLFLDPANALSGGVFNPGVTSYSVSSPFLNPKGNAYQEWSHGSMLIGDAPPDHQYDVTAGWKADCDGWYQTVDLYDFGSFVTNLYYDSGSFTKPLEKEYGPAAFPYNIPAVYGGGVINFPAVEEPNYCVPTLTQVAVVHLGCDPEKGNLYKVYLGEGIKKVVIKLDGDKVVKITETQEIYLDFDEFTWKASLKKGYEPDGPTEGIIVSEECKQPQKKGCPECDPPVQERPVTPDGQDRMMYVKYAIPKCSQYTECVESIPALLLVSQNKPFFIEVDWERDETSVNMYPIEVVVGENTYYIMWDAPAEGGFIIWAEEGVRFRESEGFYNPDAVKKFGSCSIYPSEWLSRGTHIVKHVGVMESDWVFHLLHDTNLLADAEYRGDAIIDIVGQCYADESLMECPIPW